MYSDKRIEIILIEMKTGSKRFTTEKLDKNLIVAYDCNKPTKLLFTINTTQKDFIAEYELIDKDIDKLIAYLIEIRRPIE